MDAIYIPVIVGRRFVGSNMYIRQGIERGGGVLILASRYVIE